MTEIEILDRIRRKVSFSSAAGLVLGIGDDCAIFRPRGAREDLLFTTDLLLESVHFRKNYPADAVGHKALARGLSDIAAMGGKPRFCLLSLALADWTDQHWMNDFYKGFLKLANRTGAVLAGGDLARAAQAACDVVVCGTAPKGKALRRDGAKPGDRIYVSGRLGAAALGLQTQTGRAWKQHLRPQPRLQLGQFLRAKLKASAAMDLSDGLSLDLHRLCLASGVSAAIGPPPSFPGATLEQALHGGEDYELLFTLPPKTKAPDQFQDVALTEIGVIQTGRAGTVFLRGELLAPGGYDHFRKI